MSRQPDTQWQSTIVVADDVKRTLEPLEEHWQKPSEAPYLSQVSICYLF